MGIFKIIIGNLRNRPRTIRSDDMVSYPHGYRGKLAFQKEACTGCKICAYVCSPGGISFREQDQQPYALVFNENQCTYCGKCVETCPAGALSFENRASEISQGLGLSLEEYPLPNIQCAGCQKYFLPMPVALLARHYPGKNLPPRVMELNQLCPDCRRKMASLRLCGRIAKK